MSSQGAALVLHLDLRTDAGSGKAADCRSPTTLCTAAGSEAPEAAGHRLRASSHPARAPAVPPPWQGALPLAEKAMLLW